MISNIHKAKFGLYCFGKVSDQSVFTTRLTHTQNMKSRVVNKQIHRCLQNIFVELSGRYHTTMPQENRGDTPGALERSLSETIPRKLMMRRFTTRKLLTLIITPEDPRAFHGVR